MIDVSNVTIAYGDKKVLDSCNLHIKKGEKIALMGPSGCGKTTLLGCIAGIKRPQSGKILLESKHISYVFQEPRLLPWLTALQNVNVVLSDSSATLDKAQDWLDLVHLGADSEKYPRELSGGMCQRLSICRALAYNGDVILLDEPLKGLNAELREEIAKLIREKAKDKTLLLVTHDEWEASALCERTLYYENGKFIEKTE